MKTIFRTVLFALFCFACTGDSAYASGYNTSTLPKDIKDKINASQLFLIENKGQIVDEKGKQAFNVLFSIKSENLNIFLKKNSIHYQFSKPENKSGVKAFSKQRTREYDQLATAPVTYKSYRLDVELVNANPNPVVTTENEQLYTENYYTANNNSKPVTGVKSYQKVIYHDVYPGIDWVIYTKGSVLKYDFVVREGGNPADIKIKYLGAQKIKINKDGSLTATTPLGSLTEEAPVAFTAGNNEKVNCKFSLEKNILSFITEQTNESFIIDPQLQWGTYYGGADLDNGFSVATDGSGNVYIAGSTNSFSQISTSSGHQTSLGGGYDGYLVKFNSNGQRVWATYYGGAAADYINSVYCDNSGNVLVAGQTLSANNISTSGAHQGSLAGNNDAFIAKFGSGGIRTWATYYGGGGNDYGTGITSDNTGNIYLTGYTLSASGIATSDGFQIERGGQSDAFLAKFNSDGVRQWGTYYGDLGQEQGHGVACDNSGNAYLIGFTNSALNIATSGSHQATIGGIFDAFLTKFNGTGSRIWSTYYGGTEDDDISAVKCDATGNIYISGWTASTTNMATSGSHQSSKSGLYDAYVAKFNNSGVRQWGTYYGGTMDDYGNSIALDNNGNIFLAGNTNSTGNIATAGSHKTTYGGTTDAFLVKFNNSGIRQWGTYYGDIYDDYCAGVATDPSGLAYIVGTTSSEENIASSGSHQAVFGGGAYDAFLAKLGEPDNIPPSVYLVNPTLDYCENGSVAMEYTSTGTFDPANVFTLQLSDASGNFAAPNPLGTSTSVPNGVINGTLPAGITGSGYKLRIVSSNPVLISDTASINVYAQPTATITAGGPTTFCEGSSVLLTAGAGTSYTYQWKRGGNNLNGETNQTYTATQSGSYTVEVRIGSSCVSTSTPVVVTVKPAPVVSIDTVDGTSACVGSTIRLKANGGGSYVWSYQGKTTDTLQVTSSGVFVVTVTNSEQCTASASVNVKINPLPIIEINPGTNITFCTGGFVNVIASGGTEYEWSNGNPTPDIHIDTEGEFCVTVTNEFGCTAVQCITVTESNSLSVKITGITKVCKGDSTELSVAQGFQEYQWSVPGSNDYKITVSEPGVYSVTVSNASDCSGNSSVTVTYYDTTFSSTFVVPDSAFVGKTNVFTVDDVPGWQYEWFIDGGTIVSGQGSNSIEVKWTDENENGSVKLVATNEAGCTDTIEKPIRIVKYIGTNNQYALRPVLYPNPTKEILYIKNIESDFSYKIFDVQGRLIGTDVYKNGGIQVGSLKPGVYIIQTVIGKNNEIHSDRFVKID